jgi:hypothetical protein
MAQSNPALDMLRLVNNIPLAKGLMLPTGTAVSATLISTTQLDEERRGRA